jgi:hypothetical protein
MGEGRGANGATAPIKNTYHVLYDVSLAYQNSCCLAMTLSPRDNPKRLVDEPFNGVGALSLVCA